MEFIPWDEVEKRKKEKESGVNKSKFIPTIKHISTDTKLYSRPVRFVNIDRKKD